MKKMNLKSYLAVLTLSLLAAPAAQAFTLSLDGGAAFMQNNPTGASTPAGYLGGELTFGVPLLQIGFFYDNTFLSYNVGSAALRFYGVIARLGLPANFYVDGKAGLTSTGSSDTVFGAAAGLGYAFNIGPLASIGPRVSYNYTPFQYNSIGIASNSQTTIDASLLLSVGY